MNPGAGSARQDGAVHPVLNLIRTRMAAGSRPLHRDDDARLAVVLEGGSSRAAHGGSMICELEERGLLAAFDAVYGLSLIHISEPTRLRQLSRMPSSA